MSKKNRGKIEAFDKILQGVKGANCLKYDLAKHRGGHNSVQKHWRNDERRDCFYRVNVHVHCPIVDPIPVLIAERPVDFKNFPFDRVVKNIESYDDTRKKYVEKNPTQTHLY